MFYKNDEFGFPKHAKINFQEECEVVSLYEEKTRTSPELSRVESTVYPLVPRKNVMS